MGTPCAFKNSSLLASLSDHIQNVMKNMSFTFCPPISRLLNLINWLSVWNDHVQCELLMWFHFLKWARFSGARKIGQLDLSTFWSVTLTLPLTLITLNQKNRYQVEWMSISYFPVMAPFWTCGSNIDCN